MLQNEPSVAKIGVDTAENEPIFGWIQLVQLSRFNSSILSLGAMHLIFLLAHPLRRVGARVEDKHLMGAHCSAQI